mmetsp:Transcript_124003/g.214989  ORF Transcript_124003/g.214989 Transcript_124003/m.214989 type:complete len:288 (-) Transcript_124003:395-1258(-)
MLHHSRFTSATESSPPRMRRRGMAAACAPSGLWTTPWHRLWRAMVARSCSWRVATLRSASARFTITSPSGRLPAGWWSVVQGRGARSAPSSTWWTPRRSASLTSSSRPPPSASPQKTPPPWRCSTAPSSTSPAPSWTTSRRTRSVSCGSPTSCGTRHSCSAGPTLGSPQARPPLCTPSHSCAHSAAPLPACGWRCPFRPCASRRGCCPALLHWLRMCLCCSPSPPVRGLRLPRASPALPPLILRLTRRTGPGTCRRQPSQRSPCWSGVPGLNRHPQPALPSLTSPPS